MKEPFIFLLIFSVLVIIAGVCLRTADDPRKSLFFFRVYGDPSQKEATGIAKKMSNGLFIVGTVIMIFCIVGLIRL